MTLKIVGPGFGRTGTKSTKDALELLGFGPCHHMYEVFANPPQVDHWLDVFVGKPVNWEQVFDGYTSQIDWPGAHAWRDLVTAFPDAKVLLTKRPDDSWHRSFSRTIGKLWQVHDHLDLPPHIRAMSNGLLAAVGREDLRCAMTDKAGLLAAYRRREAEVRAAVSPDRLLVFDVADGWEPLCTFLGVSVPDTPFPHENLGDDFWDAMGGEPPDP
jgi:hypothetical protein